MRALGVAAALARRTLPEIAAEIEGCHGGLGDGSADNVVPLFGKGQTLERLEAIESGEAPTVQEARVFASVFKGWPIGHFLRNMERAQLSGVHVSINREPMPAPCRWCSAPATLLCDAPGCDESICLACARVVGDDRHLCKVHGPKVRL